MNEEVNIIDFNALQKRREEYFAKHPEVLEALKNCPADWGYDITVVGPEGMETIRIGKDKK